MISLDLMKSSEVRIAGDQPNYHENMRKAADQSSNKQYIPIWNNFILGSTAKVFSRKIPSGLLHILSDLGEGHFSKGLLQSWLHYAVFNFRRKACRTKSWTQHIFLKCLIYQLRFLCSTYIVKLINFIQALTYFPNYKQIRSLSWPFNI